MTKLRNKPNKLKSNAWMKEQYANPKYCMLEDCCNEITPYKGAGQDVLCAQHQADCSEYGGMGKPDRPHTFYRNWECTKCGYDPRKDEVRFGDVKPGVCWSGRCKIFLHCKQGEVWGSIDLVVI